MAEGYVSLLSHLLQISRLNSHICFRYEQDVTLSGILHFHSIADDRMQGNPRKNLEMFRELCGTDALRNVILTTTHWDEESDDIASRREAELKSSYWKPFIDKGSRVARFYPSTPNSAWGIIDHFSAVPRRPLKVQIEMVNEGKELHETAAFKFLVQWWKNLVKRFNGTRRKRASTTPESELLCTEEKKKIVEGSRSQPPMRSRFFLLRGYSTSTAGGPKV